MQTYLLLSHSKADGITQLQNEMQRAFASTVYAATLETLPETLEPLQANGTTALIVFPLLLCDGVLLQRAKDRLSSLPFPVRTLPPLLDLPDFANILCAAFGLRQNDTLLLLAHEMPQMQPMERLCRSLTDKGCFARFAFLHGTPDIADTVQTLQKQKAEEVLRILPLLSTPPGVIP